MDDILVKNSISFNRNPVEAVSQIYKDISTGKEQYNLIFCSSNYDLNLLGLEIKKTFGPNVLCCTTSGEISSSGYTKDSIVASSISSDKMRFHSFIINNVTDFDAESAKKISGELSDIVRKSSLKNAKYLGLLIIDGLSLQEDKMIALLSKYLDTVEIVGGSSADDLKFISTHIYDDGVFKQNTAELLIIETEIPFVSFKTQHFEPTEKKLVITEADTTTRIVYEINGEKAALEYAKILGIDVKELNTQIFAKYPVMLNVGGNWYIRSIGKMNDDYSLTFFCAIDVGLVLTVAKGNDILNNLKSQLADIKKELGSISLIIAFDCILRRLEVEQNNLTEDMNKILSSENIIGFNSYGEQCQFVHVNQTLTGIAFGKH
jgi:hypothetical protein